MRPVGVEFRESREDSQMDAGRRPRALVVEDEPHVRELWCEFLKLLGWDFDQAGTGTEGLTCLAQASYDLLVTDLRMPGLNGWDLAWETRRHDPSVGVIVISGSSTSIDVNLLKEPGVTLLEKPIDLSTFRKAVQESLAARTLAAQREAEPAAATRV